MTIWPPALFGIGIGDGVNRVVVVLGVGRIDGDERHLAPILAAGQRSTGFAASASSNSAGENTCGMP